MKVMSLTLLEPTYKSREEPTPIVYRSFLHVRSHSSGTWRHFYASHPTSVGAYESRKDDPAYYEEIIGHLVYGIVYQVEADIKAQLSIMFSGNNPPLPSEVDKPMSCGTIVLQAEDGLEHDNPEEETL